MTAGENSEQSSRRILFCVETNDQWILHAARQFQSQVSDANLGQVWITGHWIDDLLVRPDQMVLDYAQASDKIIRLARRNASKEAAISVSKRWRGWESRTTTVRALSMFRTVVEWLQPDLVVVWNGLTDIRRLVVEHARSLGLPVWFAEKGMLADSWYFDPRGINAGSSLRPETFAAISAPSVEFRRHLAAKLASDGRSAWSQPKPKLRDGILNKLPPHARTRRLIFFPAQVNRDTNITVFSSLRSNIDALSLILKNLPPASHLVVKHHPKSTRSERRAIDALVRDRDDVTLVTKANIWSLIEACELIVSINSSVAFEGLLQRRKVILLGRSILCNLGLVEITAMESIGPSMHNLLNWEFDAVFDDAEIWKSFEFLRTHYYIFLDGKLSEFRKSELSAVKIRSKRLNSTEFIALFYGERGDIQLTARQRYWFRRNANKVVRLARAMIRKYYTSCLRDK